MEHRYSERHSCNLTVTVSHEDTHAVGRLLNLSTLGFYITTDSRIFLPFQLLKIDITLRGKKAGKQYSFQG
ncbi:MAG TPA: PilZ domain-containing protein, partial [Cellvibrionaceae bacterium]